MKSYTRKVELYNFKYKIVYDIASYENEMKKAGFGDVEIPKNMGGCVYHDENSDFYLIYVDCDENGMVISTIAHEAFHLADFLTERVGIYNFEGSGNEHIAYLVGHFTQVIWDTGKLYIKHLEKEESKKEIIKKEKEKC